MPVMGGTGNSTLSGSERKSARNVEVFSGPRSGGTPGPSFMLTLSSPLPGVVAL
jgi:hypothetical protein